MHGLLALSLYIAAVLLQPSEAVPIPLMPIERFDGPLWNNTRFGHGPVVNTHIQPASISHGPVTFGHFNSTFNARNVDASLHPRSMEARNLNISKALHPSEWHHSHKVVNDQDIKRRHLNLSKVLHPSEWHHSHEEVEGKNVEKRSFDFDTVDTKATPHFIHSNSTANNFSSLTPILPRRTNSSFNRFASLTPVILPRHQNYPRHLNNSKPFHPSSWHDLKSSKALHPTDWRHFKGIVDKRFVNTTSQRVQNPSERKTHSILGKRAPSNKYIFDATTGTIPEFPIADITDDPIIGTGSPAGNLQITKGFWTRVGMHSSTYTAMLAYLKPTVATNPVSYRRWVYRIYNSDTASVNNWGYWDFTLRIDYTGQTDAGGHSGVSNPHAQVTATHYRPDSTGMATVGSKSTKFQNMKTLVISVSENEILQTVGAADTLPVSLEGWLRQHVSVLKNFQGQDIDETTMVSVVDRVSVKDVASLVPAIPMSVVAHA